MSLTIAITGAAGRIGSAVCQLALDEGHTVIAIDLAPEGKLPPQERYTYKSFDLLDIAAVRAAVIGCNAIIHLAVAFSTYDAEGKLIREVPDYEMHNINTSNSYNVLTVAAELGIHKIVLASSVNAIGMIYSKRPRFDYVPLDEKHAFYPEDAYSLCKYFAELQSDSFIRRNPEMRIATLRFHWVVPDSQLSLDYLDQHRGNWKDLWGWVSLSAVAQACLLGLTASETSFPKGHETFFIVGPTIAGRRNSLQLLKETYPEITDIRGEFRGNQGFFDCSKAEKMLGWKETLDFNWTD